MAPGDYCFRPKGAEKGQEIQKHKQINFMEQKHKELYECPTTEVVEMKTDGCILQASLTQYEPLPF